MVKFWVLWTYVANYSKLIEIEAASPAQAINNTTGFFSDDFRKKATVYCFDRAPMMTQSPSE